VEKVALFCIPALGAGSQALQLRLYIGENTAKAKVYPHLEAREYRIQRPAYACQCFRMIVSKDTCEKKKVHLFSKVYAHLFVKRPATMWGE
jgi:hypothetical protein